MGNREDRFVLCIRNEGYQALLEPRKIYRVVADARPRAEACSVSSTNPAKIIHSLPIFSSLSRSPRKRTSPSLSIEAERALDAG